MAETPHSIELKIAEKLRNAGYRQAFFLAESSRLIAKQLIELRKRRGLTQAELATLADTGQPAISRVERADYNNWSFNTLRKLAEKLDARLRVYIEAAEDVLGEYDEAELTSCLLNVSASAERADTRSQVLADQPIGVSAAKSASDTSNKSASSAAPRQHSNLFGLGFIEQRIEHPKWS